MRYLFMLMLTGCAASHLPRSSSLMSPPEHVRLQRGIDAWRAAGLPWSDACDKQLPRLRIAYPTSDADSAVICKGEVNACFVYRDDGSGIWFDPGVAPVFVVRQGIRYDVWEHEAIHWMGTCSGFGADSYHQDARLWGVGVLGTWRREP